MAVSVDYYQILGVRPAATPAELKTAYHAAAKRAHPDAGGSAEAMQAINEAYAALADPATRADYDRRRATSEAAAPPHHTQQSAHRAEPHHHATHPAADPEAIARAQADRAEAERSYREAVAWARWSGLRLFVISFLVAAVLVPTMPLAAGATSSRLAKSIFAVLAYAPLHAAAIGLIFLAQPRLRLAVAALGYRGYHLNSHDRAELLIIFFSALPLAAIWVLLFNLGFIH